MNVLAVKERLLRKIFNELIPSVIRSRMIQEERGPNENIFNFNSNLNINTSISIDYDKSFEFSCGHININVYDNQRPGYYSTDATIFELKKLMIDYMIQNINLSLILKMGLNLTSEIEWAENPANLNIGAVKKILGTDLNFNIFELETRKVLLEKVFYKNDYGANK